MPRPSLLPSSLSVLMTPSIVPAPSAFRSRQIAALFFAFTALPWLALAHEVLPASVGLDNRSLLAVALSAPFTVVLVLAFWLCRSPLLTLTVLLIQTVPTAFPVYVLLRYSGTPRPEQAVWGLLFAVSMLGILFGLRALRLSRVRTAA